MQSIPTLPAVKTPSLPTVPVIFNNIKCGLSSVFDALIANKNFYFIFVNSNFVPLSIEEPIKNFLDDSLFIEMEAGKNKKADLLVRQQSMELLDDIW